MNEMIFSWAEDANGKMVHVDSVRQGLNCGCTCPCCHERLQARHGKIREHGFAHHSDNRGANLKICYMVIMYKLAEQIIQQEKKIRVPSYYGIFKGGDIEFTDVVVDSRYDREDKQPDVIATTAEGKRYLIEFTFAYKLQHKKKVDYENLNCVEIDLSSQTLETLHDFLMLSTEDRKWLNNQTYFESIVSKYLQYGKNVRITDESECANCDLKDDCCGIRRKGDTSPISIENNGNSYRVCKVEEYSECKLRREKEIEREEIEVIEIADSRRDHEEDERIETAKISPESRTCFMCSNNLDKMCQNDGYAHCSLYIRLGIKNTSPDTAKLCRGFRVKL